MLADFVSGVGEDLAHGGAHGAEGTLLPPVDVEGQVLVLDEGEDSAGDERHEKGRDDRVQHGGDFARLSLAKGDTTIPNGRQL